MRVHAASTPTSRRVCFAPSGLLLTLLAGCPDGGSDVDTTPATTGASTTAPGTTGSTGMTTEASAAPTTTDVPTTDTTTSNSTDDPSTDTGEPATTGDTTGGPLPEDPPAPSEGGGLSDPPTNTLHNHLCAGVDWQRIHGWLLLPHAAPELGPPGEMERCVERYAGWVTNEADAAMVSHASVYAALAASGQCDEGSVYNGALVAGAWCTLVNPGLTEVDCLAEMGCCAASGSARSRRCSGTLTPSRRMRATSR